MTAINTKNLCVCATYCIHVCNVNIRINTGVSLQSTKKFAFIREDHSGLCKWYRILYNMCFNCRLKRDNIGLTLNNA